MDNNQHLPRPTEQVPKDLTKPQQSEEDKFIEKVKKKNNARFLNSPKFREWYKLFTDKNNKDTFGNSTQSAIIAYKLDPVEQYGSARVIGCENLAKLNNAAADILHKKGVTFAAMMDIGFNKMIKSPSFDAWFMFMEMMGLPVPEYKPVTNVTYVQNQQNNQFNAGNNMSLSFVKEVEEDAGTGQADTSPVSDSNGQEQV